MKKFKLEILQRCNDSIVEEHYCNSIIEIEALVDEYFMTDEQLNLRNIKYYYAIYENKEGEYVRYEGKY